MIHRSESWRRRGRGTSRPNRYRATSAATAAPDSISVRTWTVASQPCRASAASRSVANIVSPQRAALSHVLGTMWIAIDGRLEFDSGRRGCDRSVSATSPSQPPDPPTEVIESRLQVEGPAHHPPRELRVGFAQLALLRPPVRSRTIDLALGAHPTTSRARLLFGACCALLVEHAAKTVSIQIRRRPRARRVADNSYAPGSRRQAVIGHPAQNTG